MDTPNTISGIRLIRGEEAFAYGLKARAKLHHCLGYGTFSVDLERLEQLRKQYCRAVRPITPRALFVKAVALAVQRNPEANAILFKKLFSRRIVQFERVDVNLPITRNVGNRTLTFIGTIRDAPSKSLAEIQEELTHYQRCPPQESFAICRMQRFDGMPLWRARLAHWRMTWSPSFYIRNVGTCGLSLMEGNWYDHFFPIAPTSVVFGIGAASRQPSVRGDSIVITRVLKCSLMVDNFVIPGLTGAKLAHDFKELLENVPFLEKEIQPSIPGAGVP